MARACLWLRTAERVLMKLASFRAVTFDELYEGVRRIRWKDYLLRTSFIHVNGKSAKSRLFSVSDCQSIAKKAIVDSLSREYGLKILPENGRRIIIEIGILRDEVTVALDCCGAGLSRRGNVLVRACPCQSLERVVLDNLILAFCRLGLAGLSPIMPGTCGSALAAVLAPFLFIPLPFVARIVVLVLVFWIGGMAATRGEQILGYKDPGEIVIDELLGMWLVLLPFSNPGWAKIGIAFVLFRIFDRWKPWPVHASESWLPGGYGIMIDDVMAGLQALLVMWLLQRVGVWCGCTV